MTLARSERPLNTLDRLEQSTMGWVGWHRTRRVRPDLGDLPPDGFEASHCAALNA